MILVDRFERVAALASFFGCTKNAAVKLDAAMALIDYRHKEKLVHQGDQWSKIWIIISGHAQLQIIDIDGQVKLLAAYGPGELFGAYPDERVVIADVIAQNTLSVLEISTAALNKLLHEEADLGHGMSRILGRQLNAVLDRMAARITLTATGRVYSELLHHAGTSNRISPPPVIAALALTAQTSRETGSRAISALERRGIIRRDEECLEIISRSMLESLII